MAEALNVICEYQNYHLEKQSHRIRSQRLCSSFHDGLAHIAQIQMGYYI